MKLYTYKVEFDNGFTNDVLIIAPSIEEAERKLLAGEWASRFQTLHASQILVFALIDELEMDSGTLAAAA